jgi:hypothetical protein
MEIQPYNGRYTNEAQLFMQKKLLARYPRQVLREDLLWDIGIDIIYDFKKLTPAEFIEYADTILDAAYSEAMRYNNERYKFCCIEIELGTKETLGGTVPVKRSYQVGMHKDPEIMVYGPGYDPYPERPDKPGKGDFLKDRVQAIINIPFAYRDRVDKQKPYKVTSLVISIREGLKTNIRKLKKEKGVETSADLSKVLRKERLAELKEKNTGIGAKEEGKKLMKNLEKKLEEQERKKLQDK